MDLGWRVVTTALKALENDDHPNEEEMADIIREACADFTKIKMFTADTE